MPTGVPWEGSRMAGVLVPEPEPVPTEDEMLVVLRLPPTCEMIVERAMLKTLFPALKRRSAESAVFMVLTLDSDREECMPDTRFAEAR